MEKGEQHMTESNPYLIALAAEIADYCVTNEHKDRITTYEAENGDIRYTPHSQRLFNDRYIYILDLLEDTFDGKILRIQEQPHGGQHDKS
tara:strand:- start:655 stop:924 length:270 start_codon:yes stop_codon:yes gene_type:complete